MSNNTSPNPTDVRIWYDFVYNACHASPTPWVQPGLTKWAPVKESQLLIQHMPNPIIASQDEMLCLLEEVRTGYLEFLFRSPWDQGRVLGYVLPWTSPSPDIKATLKTANFWPHTLQAKR